LPKVLMGPSICCCVDFSLQFHRYVAKTCSLYAYLKQAFLRKSFLD
jgi:hypothetical protein